mmetsp:Transcript_17703/g.43941  ORF Transcript_17703/g.43941 Transcript_17703/m.43941 type:complete len:152 (-) Transcript_17703:363-818(-)|eukprot:CAMPEP_0113891868 /NCGR_PEP_ID=MMETSP0780_2-20120614/15034_1 /TAXON_ID=652834 /ORGANISM="Palpitomonas bilix" /LENGTH=151 /DNA_ID=CAMNT_0000881611 /DNA_START=180 /DNA_END=635 /DNA_ORIENTATION=- /assembly_acc=CAM_ASM_000599
MAEVSKTGSSLGVTKVNGQVFAVAHSHKKTGYKAPNSETNVQSLGADTTYKNTFVPPKVTDSGKKPLVPYQANAPRNRMPVKFPNEAVPHQRFCAPRNTSTVQIGGDQSYQRQFVSTNKVSYPHIQGLPVGADNQGIMSATTQWNHYIQQQ